MKLTSIVFLGFFFVVALSVAIACAGEPGPGSRERPVVFALIVTNNHSPELARPDLRYADDDGAKYYELFRMSAPEENTHLLTELDPDTEKLFPGLGAKTPPPRREEVLAAAAAIAAPARAAVAAGKAVELYFVFAGHGDVDRGQGFLELADGRFTADDLEALLKSIPATHAHVILDSCNSFFVLNARKPGGRRFATSEDAARSLAARLPNVGVFLSTSAASEVFEWSELEAGIFSHAVRSGLMGAADANGDGRVSYAELRAFVGIASSSLRNPSFRPQIFARGPGGHDDDALLDLRPLDGAALHLDAGRRGRVTVRDRDEVPWIDLNREDGFEVTLRLPRRAAEGAFIEESDGGGIGGAAGARYAYPAEREARVSLSELSPSAHKGPLARGPGDLFRSLFSVPFGPKALAAFEVTDPARGADVYGVSSEDRARMGNMLEQVAEIERGTRILGGGTLLALGGALAATGGYTYANASGTLTPDAARASGGLNLGLGGATALGGGLLLFTRSSGEKLHDDFVAGLRLQGDPRLVIADTEERLRKMAEGDHTERLWLRWTSIALTSMGALGFAFTQSSPWLGANGQAEHNTAFASDALLTGVGVSLFLRSLFPTAVERMWRLWTEDPGLQEISSRPSVQGTLGLGTVGLSGSF